jgi:F-type H+-transporting ATPase subunit delta
MAEKVTLARPYAKAAFEAARDGKDFARWSEMLAAAAATVADARVVKLLSSPRVSPADLVELIAEASRADERGRNFLNTLAINRRLAVLPEVEAIYGSCVPRSRTSPTCTSRRPCSSTKRSARGWLQR